MTSSIAMDRPSTTPDARGRHRRRRRWLFSLGAVAMAIASAGAYVLTHAGNEPLPEGLHTVEVYTVDDAITTVVPAADRPG
ncbi:hypothetical protein BJ973_002998 [Actinoplanes tereljensis]|uniref:Uncharacterized protein n=1 Tax=Paractinoplanes tereljensis TaxID=571912 RepID=A0A919NSB7_9ACTN|nr:hypothetical protein [Actinoplanes tereljensis]GIF22677.1 hypothetical protein Ate02nite_54070 [Actinoplanes tereljensis]